MLNEQVCIIGAGLAGLSAAYELGKRGLAVTVLEASRDMGGLASYVYLGNQSIDRFYHFVCAGDRELLRLVQGLGIDGSLRWRQARTSFFYHGHMYDFGLPTDLLRFSPVPLLQRIRFGLNVIRSRYRTEWKQLDRIPASQWLATEVGRQGYKVIWDPLLRFKFGDFHSQVSAAWIWHRIHRVATSRRRLWQREYFGYLKDGSATLIDALVSCLQGMPNVSIKPESEVAEVKAVDGHVVGLQLAASKEMIPCAHVISTAALPVLLKIMPELPPDYQARLGKIDYLGVVCGLLKLGQRLTDSFWINIDDPAIPFNGIIEYSNLNTGVNEDGGSIVYVPYYLRTGSPRFSYTDKALKAEFVDGLSKINPCFDESWIEECCISRATYAQAICTVGFLELVPPIRTPIQGLLITDSTQFYPEDRTVSAAIRLGRQAADLIHPTS